MISGKHTECFGKTLALHVSHSIMTWYTFLFMAVAKTLMIKIPSTCTTRKSNSSVSVLMFFPLRFIIKTFLASLTVIQVFARVFWLVIFQGHFSLETFWTELTGEAPSLVSRGHVLTIVSTGLIAHFTNITPIFKLATVAFHVIVMALFCGERFLAFGAFPFTRIFKCCGGWASRTAQRYMSWHLPA